MAKKSVEEVKKTFIKTVKRIAKAEGKEPAEVTKQEFFSAEVLTEWELRQLGGFAAIKDLHFPMEKDLGETHGTRLVRSHRNKLEKQYGEALFVQQEILKEMKSIFAGQAVLFHKPLKTVKNKSRITRTLLAALSDTHFGCNIAREELGGINQFNWTIAARRLAYYMAQIVNYKTQYRDETELVLQVNGDIIAGLIHNQEWAVDLLTDQFVGTLTLLGQAISYLAAHFHTVRVVMTVGNHGRSMAKSDKGRATTHKWDSYEWMIFKSLEMQVAGVCKNVQFLIPQMPFAIYDVGGRFPVFQTHGDTVVNVGNPGNAISMKGIREQVNAINSSELMPGSRRVSILSVGHVHTPTVQMMDDGCTAIINGCLSGVDAYAQSLGIHSNNPVQIISEATSKHPVGDTRLIRLKDADKDADLEKIIKPYVRIVDNS